MLSVHAFGAQIAPKAIGAFAAWYAHVRGTNQLPVCQVGGEEEHKSSPLGTIG